MKRDITEFVNSFKNKKKLGGSSFLITGATGLIGSYLVHCLLAANDKISVTLPVRDMEKAKSIYGEENPRVNLFRCDLLEYVRNLDDYHDYVIHCASPTSGKYITENPVETYSLTTETTKCLLEYSKRKSIKSMVYISSIEYYGQILDDRIITEDVLGYVDPTSPRSSYPLGKRAAEYLCTAYAIEYGVPVKIARLTQTFGSKVAINDNRVFAQFARSIITGNDIVLHTSGGSAKPYCYIVDCISAILCILLDGHNGEAYNVANENTYISIRELAKFLRDNFNSDIGIRIELHPEMGYAAETRLHICTKKLASLGWIPKYDLKDMFERLIDGIKSN